MNNCAGCSQRVPEGNVCKFTGTWRTSHDYGGRDWREALTMEGTPSTAADHQKQERQGLFPDDFDFRLLDSRTMGKYVSVVFSHWVCGNLLQQF